MSSAQPMSQTFWTVSEPRFARFDGGWLAVGTHPPLAFLITVFRTLACSWSSVRLDEWSLCLGPMSVFGQTESVSEEDGASRACSGPVRAAC